MEEFRNIHLWPKFSDNIKYLCLIRNINNKKEYGFLIEGSWFVNLGYVWDGGTGEFLEYNSIEEIINDGWEID